MSFFYTARQNRPEVAKNPLISSTYKEEYFAYLLKKEYKKLTTLKKDMSMNVTNLKNSPELVTQTLNLIERSFEYTPEHSFDVDFYPLFNKDNFLNCFVVVEDDRVLAHIGRLTKIFKVNNQDYSFNMYGGIAVDEGARGKGLFKEFFHEILSRETNNIVFSLLWSEKVDLYRKFSFYPCIELNAYNQTNVTYHKSFKVEKRSLRDLNESELNRIKSLYNQNNELRPKRDDHNWVDLAKIHSSDLYLIYKEDKIVNYFFMNKGQDLTNIIHEYGYIDEEQLSLMLQYGQVWSTFVSDKQKLNQLFGSLARINNRKLFTDYVRSYAGLELTNITDSYIDFDFEGKRHQFAHEEFLQGLWGPGRFQELSINPLFICGLDSI